MVLSEENSYVKLEEAEVYVSSCFSKTELKRVAWNELTDEDKSSLLIKAFYQLENLNYQQSDRLNYAQIKCFPRYKAGLNHRQFNLFNGSILFDYQVAQIQQALSYALDGLMINDTFVKSLSIGKESRVFDETYIKHKARIHNRYGICVEAFEVLKKWILGTY